MLSILININNKEHLIKQNIKLKMLYLKMSKINIYLIQIKTYIIIIFIIIFVIFQYMLFHILTQIYQNYIHAYIIYLFHLQYLKIA